MRESKEKNIWKTQYGKSALLKAGISGGLSLVGMEGGAIGSKILDYTGLGFFGKQAYETYKDPTPENMASLSLNTLAIIPVVTKAVKNVYKKAGAEYIPPEKVFGL